MGTPPEIVPDALVGKAIGHYTVRHKIAEGSMGSVYVAEHPAIGKRVALKVLHGEFASQPEIVRRFFNEAKAVNDIQHPNIVDIVDFGVIASDSPGEPAVVYLLMEYLDGESLGSLIRREAPLPLERAMPIALQIADALSASHQRGIVHRDLKPDNVMLVSRGRRHDFVKVLDFGLAKLTDSSHHTRTGMMMGTPQYMSPEQCEGRSNIDHRTDIYAFGIVLYEMLTGRVPFVGDGYGEVLAQQVAMPPLAPSAITPGIPEHVELVVLKALEKRADDRYQHVADLVGALQDPLQYVAAHGGTAGFLASPVLRATPAAATAATRAMVIARPERVVPSTLSGMAAQVTMTTMPRHGMRVGVALWLAAAIAVAGAVIGIAARGIGEPADRRTAAVLPTEPPAGGVVDAGTVLVVIESRPPGAHVTIGGRGRGTTPYAGDLDRQDTPVEIELALPGYAPAIRRIALSTDVVLSLSLDSARPSEQAPARGR